MTIPLTGAGSGSGVAGLPLSDTFAATDGTTLSGRSLETGGTTWTVSGTWSITNNKARKTASGATHQYATADALSATHDVSVVCTTANVLGGAVGRYTDDSNHWATRVSGTSLELYEKNAGSFITRGTASFTPGATHTSRLQCSGASVTGYGDAVSVNYALATFNQTATRVGIWQNSAGANDQFDNFAAV